MMFRSMESVEMRPYIVTIAYLQSPLTDLPNDTVQTVNHLLMSAKSYHKNNTWIFFTGEYTPHSSVVRGKFSHQMDINHVPVDGQNCAQGA